MPLLGGQRGALPLERVAFIQYHNQKFYRVCIDANRLSCDKLVMCLYCNQDVLNVIVTQTIEWYTCVYQLITTVMVISPACCRMEKLSKAAAVQKDLWYERRQIKWLTS